jgi:hypothetical protein
VIYTRSVAMGRDFKNFLMSSLFFSKILFFTNRASLSDELALSDKLMKYGYSK